MLFFAQQTVSFSAESYINFCTQCAIMTQTRRPPSTPSHLGHSQSFDKIDSFLKSVLNILILCHLIVGWGVGVIKEGDGVFVSNLQIQRRCLKVGESIIHQSKCWYYLGPFQTLKAELFAKIVFGYKPLNFFVKSSNLDVSLVL